MKVSLSSQEFTFHSAAQAGLLYTINNTIIVYTISGKALFRELRLLSEASQVMRTHGSAALYVVASGVLHQASYRRFCCI